MPGRAHRKTNRNPVGHPPKEDCFMATKSLRATRPLGNSYLALIEEFPLRPIRSEAELNRAIAVVDALSDRSKLSRDEHDYLLVLAGLIEAFEDAHQPIPPVAGVAMLRPLIEFKGVTQAQVATATGIAESTLSELLAGKRKLATKHITALAKYFKVDPALLLPD
jgi:HTH-type transcriptional regulator/antitoxin HigA